MAKEEKIKEEELDDNYEMYDSPFTLKEYLGEKIFKDEEEFLLELGKTERKKINVEIYDGHIIGLHLVNSGLKEFPKKISRLSHLGQLNLSKNKIKIIPDIFNEFPNLWRLNLTENKIEDIPLTLGNVASGCDPQSPSKLDLSYNRIVTIPKSLRFRVGTIDLSHNCISEISECEWQFTTLNLSHNKIKKIPNLLKVHYFEKIDLSYNEIHNFPDYLYTIQKTRKYCNIVEINLERNSIQDVDLDKVPKFIKLGKQAKISDPENYRQLDNWF